VSPTLFLDEIVDHLAAMHGVFLTKTGFHNNHHDLGLTHKMVQRNAAKRDEDAGAAWREDIAANCCSG
jgi:transposase